MNKKIFYDANKCMFCGTCELACSLAHSGGKNLGQMQREQFFPLSRIKIEGSVLGTEAIFCHNCDHPYCREACIANALDIISEKVYFNEENCVNCYSCVMGCPFEAVSVCLEKIIRCDGCGDWENPHCVKECPTGALVYEDPAKYSQSKRRSFSRAACNISQEGDKSRG